MYINIFKDQRRKGAMRKQWY